MSTTGLRPVYWIKLPYQKSAYLTSDFLYICFNNIPPNGGVFILIRALREKLVRYLDLFSWMCHFSNAKNPTDGKTET